jgi:hypothetical protein
MYFPAKIRFSNIQSKIFGAEKRKTPTITQKFCAEVIDQKNKIALVTAINHPDVAALKRSIESNAQRKVTITNAINSQKNNDCITFISTKHCF